MAFKDPAKRLEYERAYYAANRDRERERRRAYYAANRDRERERNRVYRETNLDRERERNRVYRETNLDRERERDRVYRETNRDYLASQDKRWKRNIAQIPAPRNGSRWTAAEDAIALRDDITVKEMCFMLGRSWLAIYRRRENLKRGADQCSGRVA